MRDSRSRIKGEISEYFKNEILYPGIRAEYENGFEEMILLNKAFALMLTEEKIIDSKSAKEILNGLTFVEEDFGYDDLDGKFEELYFNIEQKLIQKIGVKIGGKLHTGRSRNDIYATLWRMEVRRSLWNLFQQIINLQETLLMKVKENADVVITGYTHMQPAQPITVGFYYSAVLSVLNRDFCRLKDAYGRVNLSPYGAAALAGTGFPINREALNDLLGFEGVLENTLDCVSSKDYLLEVESALSIMMINLSRVIQDHYIWATNEFGILDIDGALAVCSSIMPQKKNPVALELAKAKAAHIIGALMSSICALKNTPFSLCMDLFESHSQYWNGQKETGHVLTLLNETLKQSTIKRNLTYAQAKANFSTVTALADLLVQQFNVSFAEAHDIVGHMVGVTIEHGLSIEAMNSNLLKTASQKILGYEIHLADEEIVAVLEPMANVQSKISMGSPGASSLEKMIANSEIQLNKEKVWLRDKINQVEQAYQTILQKEAGL